jgi:hypothetical protein
MNTLNKWLVEPMKVPAASWLSLGGLKQQRQVAATGQGAGIKYEYVCV